MSNNRRKFLKNVGLMSAGIMIFNPLSAFNLPSDSTPKKNPKKPEAFKGAKKLSILQTTDVHCQIHPHDELFWENEKAVFRRTGGYSYISTYLDQLKSEADHTFTLDTGDMFQGSELSIGTLGKAYVPILNKLDYDLYLPGNWEVVYGKEQMQTLMGQLKGPKVCANMFHDLGDGKRGPLIYPPYHVWYVEGVKIGFLGYTDHLVPVRQSPDYSKGILYKKPEENIAHYVDVLKNQEGCDMIMVVAHNGLSQQIALSNHPAADGVDYILGGDTHERVRRPIVGKYAKVVEPGAFGSFIGKLDLYVKDGKIVGEEYELVEVATEGVKADRSMDRLLSDIEKPFLNSIDEVIGYSTIPLYRYFVIENPIDTLIIDSLKEKYDDIDIVLSNGFRFCPPRSTPDHTGNIPITNGYLFDMLPIDSPVRRGEVTGQQISDWLENELNNVFAEDAKERFGGWMIKFKGMEIEFYAFKPKGKRVKKVTIGNEPLDLKRVYSILACERDGDPEDVLCRMRNVKNTRNLGSTLHDVVKEHLAKGPVTPTPPQRAVCLDADQTLLSQVSGVDYEFV